MREPFPFDSLLQQVDATIEQARELGAGLSDEQIAWTPPEGGWGVGQCFEHLIVVADQYEATLGPCLEKARKEARTPSLAGHTPTLAGRFLINGVKAANPRRLKAPRVFAPSPKARENVVEGFCDRHDRVAEAVRQARGIDLCAYKVASPVSRLIRLNLGDALLVLVYHAERHLNQATRVTEHPEFPRA